MPSLLSESTIPPSALASSRYGVIERFRYGDDLSADQGVRNVRVERPMYARLLLNRNYWLTDYACPPYQHTPQPGVANWVPNPPPRASVVGKSGGSQTPQPGLMDSLFLDSTQRAHTMFLGSRLSVGDTGHTLNYLNFTGFNTIE